MIAFMLQQKASKRMLTSQDPNAGYLWTVDGALYAQPGTVGVT